MGCLVNCFQAKLLAIRAVRIRLIVGLPVARGTHEKSITMFNGFAKPAQHTAWQWRRWRGVVGRGLGLDAGDGGDSGTPPGF